MPSVVADQLDPNSQGAEIHLCSKDGASVSEDGEKRSFLINPAATPSSGQIFAHVASPEQRTSGGVYGERFFPDMTEEQLNNIPDEMREVMLEHYPHLQRRVQGQAGAVRVGNPGPFR
jgi:hypothetical protein